MTHDPFLGQLAELCARERTTPKWVFVPSHAIGHTLGLRLAREAGAWANLRLVTPLDVALRTAGPVLLEQGLEPFDEALGPALTMRWLLDLPPSDGYFRSLAEHVSVADALWATLQELRLAGLTSRELRPEAFVAPAKHRELSSLLATFERHLEREQQADRAMVFAWAARHAARSPIQPTDIVVELPDTVWSPVVRRFLDALPGRRLRARTLDLPGVTLPPRAQSCAAPVERVSPSRRHDADGLRCLQQPQAAGPPRKDGSLTVFHAGGREAELDEVCRRILATGCPLDQVEIACATEAHALLAWEKAVRLDWPVTTSTGIPAATTRPGRLLLRYCEWLASDFAAASLRRLLQSGDCVPRLFSEADDLAADQRQGSVTAGAGRGGTGRAEDAARAAVGTAAVGGEAAATSATGQRHHPDRVPLSAGQAARLLLRAQATWGRETHASALARLAGEYDRRAEDTEADEDERTRSRERAAQARLLGEWIATLLDAIPEPGPDGLLSPAALAETAARFLEQNAARHGAGDAAALSAVAAGLRALGALGDHRCPPGAAVEMLRSVVEATRVAQGHPRPGHLHVSRLADAGFDGRPLVFVVGLEEGAVFPPAREDPVLLDEERGRLHPVLRTSTTRVDEAVVRVLSRLAAIGRSAGSVVVSFSCRDTREFRDTFPSWVVLQVHRLARGDAALTYEDLARDLGEPVSAVPRRAELAPTEAAWWLATCAARDGARPAILRAFPALARGARAEQARESAAFTEFDGFVPEAGRVLDPSRDDRVVSVSGLEDAAACPFRHFLRRGLGVDPLEEAEPDADTWLSALDRGRELHELFARYVRFVRDGSRTPDLRRDLPRLRAWADSRLRDLRRELPPPSEEVFERERQEFLDDVEAFLAAECEGRHGRDPIGVEVGFGVPLDGAHEEPLAHDEPLEIHLGRSRHVRVCGRIDRVNRLRPGQYEVLDYKTGVFWREDWAGVFAGGRRLQHAVYARAAEHLLARRGRRGRVVRAVYAFPAMRGHRQRKVIEVSSDEALRAVLRPLVDLIAAGAFLVSEDTRPCRYCDFAAACHAHGEGASEEDGVTRGAAKLERAANTVLDPLRRLRRHE